jgi:hypothetical protein
MKPGATAQGMAPGLVPGMLPQGGMLPPGMMGPGRPMMGPYGPVPGMPTSLQPNMGTLPPGMPQQPPRGPVSKAPDGMKVQLTDYRGAPLQPAAVVESPSKSVQQTSTYSPDQKPASAKNWWSTGDSK